ncbi:hypothetical protein ACEWY4_023739 [Coilia grayii]|uniref:Neurotransmitter-gated ion-channel ligand-binding domain-containing protein n=1 Tax=Coilia grayii TaxID=363190 RepID=A0ABD1IYD1_9TELE
MTDAWFVPNMMRSCRVGVTRVYAQNKPDKSKRQALKGYDNFPSAEPDTIPRVTIIVQRHASLHILIPQQDEKNQVLTTNIWLNMKWFDHYLQWNQTEYPGVKNLRFTTEQVWTPDILLYNSADDKFDSTFKTNVLCNSSGYCEYLPPEDASTAVVTELTGGEPQVGAV